MLKKAFTLIEVMIVVAILAILVVTLTFSLTRERDKANNARAKADLAQLQIAFENYYNDHNCYPPATYFDSADDCGTDQLSPYLPQILCDQRTGMPYVLETDATSCSWYRLYAQLDSPASDPDALALYSDSGSTQGNYGVSSSNTTVSVFFPLSSPSPSPTSSSPPASSTPQPSASFDPNSTYSYCYNAANHDCNDFNPSLLNCTPYFVNDPYCGGCTSNGSCTPR